MIGSGRGGWLVRFGLNGRSGENNLFLRFQRIPRLEYSTKLNTENSLDTGYSFHTHPERSGLFLD